MGGLDELGVGVGFSNNDGRDLSQVGREVGRAESEGWLGEG